jgi:Putative DNA-binding domain
MESFSLIELQNWMQGMLVKHVPVSDNHRGEVIKIEEMVNSSKRLNAIHHLNIYRHSYIARLRACMQNQFSALAYALGADLFEAFADQYLDTYPSESYTLNTLGEKFASFLEKTRPDAELDEKETWPDFMIELAGFEYALSVIFDEHAEEHHPIATLDTADNQLKLTPVFHLFQHQYPVCKYYLDFSQQQEPELPFSEESYCVINRRNYKLGLFTVKGAQYYFLLSMQQGRSVDEAKQDLISRFNFNPADVDAIWPEWKKNFITSGFFDAV